MENKFKQEGKHLLFLKAQGLPDDSESDLCGKIHHAIITSREIVIQADMPVIAKIIDFKRIPQDASSKMPKAMIILEVDANGYSKIMEKIGSNKNGCEINYYPGLNFEISTLEAKEVPSISCNLQVLSQLVYPNRQERGKINFINNEDNKMNLKTILININNESRQILLDNSHCDILIKKNKTNVGTRPNPIRLSVADHVFYYKGEAIGSIATPLDFTCINIKIKQDSKNAMEFANLIKDQYPKLNFLKDVISDSIGWIESVDGVLFQIGLIDRVNGVNKLRVKAKRAGVKNTAANHPVYAGVQIALSVFESKEDADNEALAINNDIKNGSLKMIKNTIDPRFNGEPTHVIVEERYRMPFEYNNQNVSVYVVVALVKILMEKVNTIGEIEFSNLAAKLYSHNNLQVATRDMVKSRYVMPTPAKPAFRKHFFGRELEMKVSNLGPNDTHSIEYRQSVNYGQLDGGVQPIDSMGKHTENSATQKQTTCSKNSVNTYKEAEEHFKSTEIKTTIIKRIPYGKGIRSYSSLLKDLRTFPENYEFTLNHKIVKEVTGLIKDIEFDKDANTTFLEVSFANDTIASRATKLFIEGKLEENTYYIFPVLKSMIPSDVGAKLRSKISKSTENILSDYLEKSSISNTAISNTAKREAILKVIDTLDGVKNNDSAFNLKKHILSTLKADDDLPSLAKLSLDRAIIRLQDSKIQKNIPSEIELEISQPIMIFKYDRKIRDGRANDFFVTIDIMDASFRCSIKDISWVKTSDNHEGKPMITVLLSKSMARATEAYGFNINKQTQSMRIGKLIDKETNQVVSLVNIPSVEDLSYYRREKKLKDFNGDTINFSIADMPLCNPTVKIIKVESEVKNIHQYQNVKQKEDYVIELIPMATFTDPKDANDACNAIRKDKTIANKDLIFKKNTELRGKCLDVFIVQNVDKTLTVKAEIEFKKAIADKHRLLINKIKQEAIDTESNSCQNSEVKDSNPNTASENKEEDAYVSMEYIEIKFESLKDAQKYADLLNKDCSKITKTEFLPIVKNDIFKDFKGLVKSAEVRTGYPDGGYGKNCYYVILIILVNKSLVSELFWKGITLDKIKQSARMRAKTIAKGQLETITIYDCDASTHDENSALLKISNIVENNNMKWTNAFGTYEIIYLYIKPAQRPTGVFRIKAKAIKC